MNRPVTDEQAWLPWLAELPGFPDQPVERVVVLAAHPDDETLGVSGLLQRLHAGGARIDLVVATDGEAAFPDLSAHDRTELRRRRRRELQDSLAIQELSDVRVHWLGLPDSDLATHRTELAEQLVELVADAELCLAPWPGDPHPDHRTVGEVALRVAPITTHRWTYPIWAWHWLRPQDEQLPRCTAFAHRLDATQRERKAAGIAAFTSQLKPGPYGQEPILDAATLTHFERDVEVVFRHPLRHGAPLSRFEALYDNAEDPWQVTTSWYERRKQDMVLASLPRQRYDTIVEPACGIGVLTTALAARCDRLIAFDPIPTAIGRCQARTRDLDNVTVELGVLPTSLPTGPVDLVVFSEILYYLSDTDLKTTIDQAVGALRPGGQILAVHWLPWAPEAPRDGRAAHRKLLAHPCLDRRVEHIDEQFLLHVLSRR